MQLWRSLSTLFRFKITRGKSGILNRIEHHICGCILCIIEQWSSVHVEEPEYPIYLLTIMHSGHDT